MTILLLVVFVVSVVIAAILDRKYVEANRLRLAYRHDGVAFTPNQIENRKLLRHVVWLWMYGYVPPAPFSDSQRVVIRFVTALVITGVAGAIVSLIQRLL